MHKLDCYKTIDGNVHLSLDDAVRHAERVYGEALTRYAHYMIGIGKYSVMCEYLDSHLNEFAYLLKLKKDITLTNKYDTNEDES